MPPPILRVPFARSFAVVATTGFVAAGLLAAPGHHEAQEHSRPQQPAFRSGVQLLEVDVVATDARGRPVMDLAPEELELYDDGERQEIAFFTAVSLPIQAPRPPVLRDVASNAFSEDGRLFLLILDDVHSLRETTPVITAAARRLVERLSPQDQLAVLWLSTQKQGAFEFTANHAAVLAAIDDFRARKARAELLGPPLLESLGDPTPDIQKMLEAARPFKMVKDLSGYVASIPRRRKAIVYIGQGPTGALLSDRLDQNTRVEIIQAVQAARRANVALYVIDPSGRLTPGAEGYADEPGPLSFRDLARIRQDSMAAFGEATGGFWGTGTRAVDLVDRIVTETSQYYLLGYYPPPPTGQRMRWWKEVLGDPWARFRSIEVRTSRPGVQIRARKGYWQDDARPGENAPPPVVAGTETVRAVAEVLPQSALPLRAVAVPFRGGPSAKRHPVAIAVEVTATPRDGQPELAELYAAAIEPGRGLRKTDRVSARFGTEEGTDRISRYLVCARLELEPGRYQLRLGVKSAWAQAAGSVYVDVEVPDYRKERLSLSGLVLDQQSDGRPVPAARTGTIAALVPSPPSLARRFTAGDLVWTQVEIYRGSKAPDAPVEVITALGREGEAEAVWHAREAFPPSAFGRASRVVSRVPLPLADLPSGAYRLRVTATTAALSDEEEPPTVRREMDIQVMGTTTRRQ